MEPPKKTDPDGALQSYRSECAAARQSCERAADSAGMEKGTHGLAAYLGTWAANEKLKPPADAEERGLNLDTIFSELDVTLRASRALADGTATDKKAVDALDSAAKAIRANVASARENAAAVDLAIRDFLKREPQTDLAKHLAASADDVTETTLPTIENAARSLANARDALKRYLEASK